MGIFPSRPSGTLLAQLTFSSSGGYSFPQAEINQTNGGDFAPLRIGTTGTTNIWDIAGCNAAGSRQRNFWAGCSAGGGGDVMSLRPDDATNLL